MTLVQHVLIKSCFFVFFSEPTVHELTPEPAAAREPTPEIISIYKPDLARKSLSAVSAAASSEKNVGSPLSFGSSIGGKMKRDKSYSLRASSGTRGNDNVEEEVRFLFKLLLIGSCLEYTLQ